MDSLPQLLPADHAAMPFPQGAAWGDLVVTGGHVGSFDPLALDVHTQIEQAMTALQATLEAGGASLQTIVRLEAFLGDRAHFAAWNAAYEAWFPARRPPRTTLVSAFVVEGMLFEVQALAVRVQ
jgi:2-iminobutanoate/2-iminopropanoate deaminase